MSDFHQNGIVTDVLGHPRERPLIPSWNRVKAAIPDLPERLCQAVGRDHAGQVSRRRRQGIAHPLCWV